MRFPTWPRRPRHAGLLGALVALSACVNGGDGSRLPAQPTSEAATAADAPPPLATGRLPATAKPLRYEVSLAIDPAQPRFTGNVAIAVEVPVETRTVVLHGRDLTVSRAEVMVDGKSIGAEASFRKAGGREPDELVLALARPLPAGRAEIRIAYSAPLGDKLIGLYRVKDGDLWYAFTQFEPNDARRMIPCFDDPSFKVPFELRVTTPKGNVAVANTPEVERAGVEDGRSTLFRFAPTPPLPSYLFALAVGPFEIREGSQSPVKIRLVTTKGKAALGDLALEAAAAHVKLLGEYFDRPFPYPKLDIVAVPDFFGGMENAGLISLREESILFDAKTASVDARRTLATLIAHEIAHHWFGNLVTMQWWDDLWLSEGFATWLESKIVDTWRPSMEVRLEALLAKDAAMGVDALTAARAVRQKVTSSSEAEEAFDGLTYDKGAAVLGMLERWLGPDAFRAGVRAFVKAHEHGNATAMDLFDALAKASALDVISIAQAFLDVPGVPLVRAELVCNPGVPPRVKLSQGRFRAKGGTELYGGPWRIPICIAHEVGGKVGSTCGVTSGSRYELELPAGRCPRWIHPNADEIGYFRFTLPPAQMAALAGAGRSLGVRSRIGLVANTWALVQSGDMGSDTLIGLLEGMKRERHRLVIEQIADALERLGDAIADDAARPAFRAFAASLLVPMAKEIGWDARPRDTDEQKLHRKRVLDAAARLTDDAWIVSEAEKRAAAFLKDPRSVDLDIASIALRTAARRSGEKRFAELGAAAQKETLPDRRVALIGALGGFTDPALLRRGLDTLVAENAHVHDGFRVLTNALLWPENRPVVRAWLKEHVAEVKQRVPDFAFVRVTRVVETICDADARADAAAFLGDALKGTDGGERAMAQALERADLCIDLRGREAARAKKRLGGKRGK